MGSIPSCLQNLGHRSNGSENNKSYNGREKGKWLKRTPKTKTQLTIDLFPNRVPIVGLNKEPGNSDPQPSSTLYPGSLLGPQPNSSLIEYSSSTLDELYPPLKSVKKCPGAESTDGGPLSEYVMDSRIRGPVFIINNFVGGASGFEFRRGSSNDVGKLTNVFTQLNFSMHDEAIQANLTAEEMTDFCWKSASRDFSESDCVVMVILTHGSKFGYISGVDGKTVRLVDLISPFYADNSPTLIGKPKIFIIQACRGQDYSIGVKEPSDCKEATTSPPGQEDRCDEGTRASTNDLNQETRKESDNSFDECGVSSGFLPRNADIILAFTTSENEKAFRKTNKGSLYIEQLVKALFKNMDRSEHQSKKHFVEILTEVQGHMSNQIIGKEGYVQMPEFRSTLRGPIYL